MVEFTIIGKLVDNDERLLLLLLLITTAMSRLIVGEPKVSEVHESGEKESFLSKSYSCRWGNGLTLSTVICHMCGKLRWSKYLLIGSFSIFPTREI